MSRLTVHRSILWAGLLVAVLGTMAAGSGNGGYQVHLQFTNADGLVQGNEVLVSGVKAGQVEKLEVKDNLADVTVNLDQRFAPLRADSKAVIRSLGLLGNHYIEVIPGPQTSAELPADSTLTIASTTSPTDLDQVNGIFDAPTREKVKTLTLEGEIALGSRAQALNQDLAQLRNLAVAAEPLTGVLDSHQVALDRATVAFDTLTQKLVREKQSLAGLLEHGDSVLSDVQAHDQQLAGLLQHGDASLGRLSAVLNGNEDNLAAVLAAQPGVLRTTDYTATASTPVLKSAQSFFPDLFTLIGYMADSTTSRDGPGNPDDFNSGTQYMLRVLATPCDQVSPANHC